ncbi:acyltransferase [Virgibacillus sp. LDC1]|nr:acyltransferase [Virgibacillus sp. LDC1]
MRFLAAVLVIFSHAYPLTAHNGELFSKLSNGQWDLGSMAVAIFFTISGFLVTQSFDKSNNFWTFTKSRVLRIYPGLIAATFFCAFVVGPIVTTLSMKDYLGDERTYEYLKVVFMFPMHWTLPGVFEDTFSFNNSINGSLWTIPYEILCYAIVAVIGIFGALKRKEILLFLFVFSIYGRLFLRSYVPENISWVYLPSLIDLFPFFASGMLVYSYRDKIPLNKWYALISLVLIITSIKFGGLIDVFTVCGGYLIFYLSYHNKIRFHNFGKRGDLSYGIYIYAFPVQQTVTYLWGAGIPVIANILISIPVVLGLAFLSWHFIEKPAMKLKNWSFKSKVTKEGSVVVSKAKTLQ